jgi:hypothetical protein
MTTPAPWCTGPFMNEAVQTRFLSDCWTVVRARGRQDAFIAKKAQTAWGMNPDGAICFKDRAVEIVAEAKPSRRILVTKRGTSPQGTAMSTPVVYTDNEGNPVRWHGEYLKIAAHMRVLAMGTEKEPPKTSSEG